jgi:glycosyltransferase involved in cell wall biosynthesis
MQGFSYMPRFGILSTGPATACGIASFSAALAEGLASKGADVSVIDIGATQDTTDARDSVAEELNQRDVAVIQHDYDVYGRPDGDDVLEVMKALRIPSIVIAHTVLKEPTPHQRSVLEDIVALADQVVVMSQAAHQRLCTDYTVDHHKVVTIPHGASLPGFTAASDDARPTILTWGLIGPGKGIERVIEAIATLQDLPNPPRYLIAGPTRPNVDGEAYREALIEKAQRLGVTDSVDVDAVYRDAADLTELLQAAAVVVLPYDSRDQAASGVLAASVAGGRPVVATAFPHAVELLGSGAGTVVEHDDPEALVAALRRLLTDHRAADAMAAKARELAPTMAWPVVADAYLTHGRRLVAARLALT